VKGYAGKFLRINLSSGKITDEPIPSLIIMDFIGGLGFGIKCLYDSEIGVP
jgi:aldehyde:ferredoxin oxidoreductase